jgi:hypothetical protein
MPEGHDMDANTTGLGWAVLGAMATSAGHWLWRRMFTSQRTSPMSVRELRNVIAEAESTAKKRSEAQDQNIREVLRIVEDLRTQISEVKGTADGLLEWKSRMSAASGHGD